MYLGKTLFAQVMDFLPWKTFHRIVDRYSGDHRIRTLSCAEQFRVMAFAQLTYRESLRDIEVCLLAQVGKLYHMGIGEPVARSTLADANELRDWRIYFEFAQRLIVKARALYANEDFGVELANTVYALDATTIDLCLSMFPWAPFRSTKAAVKLHTLLDLRGSIPTFIHISDGKLHDVNVLDLLIIEAGAFYVMDRGYLDFERLYALDQAGSLLRHARQAQSRCTALVLGAGGSQQRTDLRPDHRAQRLLRRQALPRPLAPHPLPRPRNGQDAGVLDQSVRSAATDDLRVVQVPLAGGVVLQVDQAASENQALLRHLGERRQNANLDRHLRLRAGGDYQEATQTGRVLAYAVTDIVANALRETTAATSSCRYRPDQ